MNARQPFIASQAHAKISMRLVPHQTSDEITALFQAPSPGGREAREKLQNLQRPSARSAPTDIEKQQAYIGAHCPDLHRDGVWLADWIWVRHP